MGGLHTPHQESQLILPVPPCQLYATYPSCMQSGGSGDVRAYRMPAVTSGVEWPELSFVRG